MSWIKVTSPLFSHINPSFPPPPRFMAAFQKSAMKPHTSTITTPESLGAGSTSGTWSSARVQPGKSSARESATQVRVSAFLHLNELENEFITDAYQAKRKGVTSPPSPRCFDQAPWLQPRLG